VAELALVCDHTVGETPSPDQTEDAMPNLNVGDRLATLENDSGHLDPRDIQWRPRGRGVLALSLENIGRIETHVARRDQHLELPWPRIGPFSYSYDLASAGAAIDHAPHQYAIQPPSTRRLVPETYSESSDARKLTAPATSPGRPRRENGVRDLA
jgi:hypothetical protein